MRVICAILAFLCIVSAACAAPMRNMPPRRTGPVVLSIAQVKSIFPVPKNPINIAKAGGPPDDVATRSTSTNPGVNPEGSPAYKTGSGVTMTASAPSDPTTASALMCAYCLFSPSGLGKTPDGGILCQIPAVPSGQSSTFAFAWANFVRMPQTQHLYLLTMNISVQYLANSLKVMVGSQEIGKSDIKVNGDVVGIVFTYNAGAPENYGYLPVRIRWTGAGAPQPQTTILGFNSIQLMQLD
jgi:hypothetical protein